MLSFINNLPAVIWLKKWLGVVKYPLAAMTIASGSFIFIIFVLYLQEEHRTHLAYVDEARKEKEQQISAEYRHIVSLLKNFVFFNGRHTIETVKKGGSLASMNFNFFVKENSSVINLYVFDLDLQLLKQFRDRPDDGERAWRRLQDIKFIEGYFFENNDRYVDGEGIHKVFFPVAEHGYLVFILNNEILETATKDNLFETNFYNESFVIFAGSQVRAVGDTADNAFSQLLIGEERGLYNYLGEDFSFGNILLQNGTIYLTVAAADINRSRLVLYSIIALLIQLPIIFLICFGLIRNIKRKVIGREKSYEYEDPVIKRLERSIKLSIDNANRILDSHLDVQVLKEDLIECREQLAHRRIKEKEHDE